MIPATHAKVLPVVSVAPARKANVFNAIDIRLVALTIPAAVHLAGVPIV